MSAYIVGDKTINIIINAIRQSYDKDQKLFIKPQINSLFNYVFFEQTWENIGNELFKLNIEAVEARYGKGQASEFRDLDYKYSEMTITDSKEVSDRIGEFLYQCFEGDCDKTDLFLDLNRWKKLNGWGSMFAEGYDPDDKKESMTTFKY